MDHDKLVTIIQKLQDWLTEHTPTDDGYSQVEELLIKLVKLEIDFNEACDKQLERQNKFELERDKSNRELDLKEKEIELKNGIEAMKLEDNSNDTKNRRRMEKYQAGWDIAKIVLQGACTGLLIVLTGVTEQQVILGQHKWSLIPKFK